MKIYCAGWVLQAPDLNPLKKLIRLNNLEISGIIYPKKTSSEIEGIPIIDFEEAAKTIKSDSLVLKASLNKNLQKEFQSFFEKLGVELKSIPAFISDLITNDHLNELHIPFDGVSSECIRQLRASQSPDLIESECLDLESYDVLKKLDVIFRTSDWGGLYGFDFDQTKESALFKIIENFYSRGTLQRVRVLDSSVVFLNVLLKLKMQNPHVKLSVELSEAAVRELGPRNEFYRRSLADWFIPSEGDSRPFKANETLLSGSADPISAAVNNGLQSAIFFMRRSVIDYSRLKEEMGHRPFRVLLRQPDTSASNLLCVFLAPAVTS